MTWHLTEEYKQEAEDYLIQRGIRYKYTLLKSYANGRMHSFFIYRSKEYYYYYWNLHNFYNTILQEMKK